MHTLTPSGTSARHPNDVADPLCFTDAATAQMERLVADFGRMYQERNDALREVAQAHHERWDGGGYPSQLAGEDIALSGRIVAVVDFFDALTMDRCYRPVFSDAAALKMLQDERGRAFDPHVVDTLSNTSAR